MSTHPPPVDPVMLETAPDAPAELVRPRRSLPRLSMATTFSALRHRNYRLWFLGQLASLVGTWMQSTAQGYLIYTITQSPVYLGYVGFAAGAPSWILMLFGGVVSDRVSRRKLLVITQTSAMILAFVLAGLTFTGVVQPWHIIVLAFLLGVTNAFDAPARQSFILEMVTREDMGNAIALNAAMFNSATAVGPAIAGLAYAALGPGWCFTINGISFIAVIVALLMMRMAPFQPPAERRSAVTELKEGLTYVARHKDIRVLIAMLGITTIFGMAYATLIPAWAVNILRGDATTNGLLQSARGVGSLIGALIIASLGVFRYKGKLLTVGSFVFPGLLIVFAGIRSQALSMLVLVGVGLGFMIYSNLTQSIVQHLVPDQLRGRVMGIYSLVFFGMFPVGAMLGGVLAGLLGSPLTVTITASVSLVFSIILFVFFPYIRDLE